MVNKQPKMQGESLFEMLEKTAVAGATEDEETLAGLRLFFDYFAEVRRQAIETNCPSRVVHSIMQDLFFGKILANEDVPMGVRDARNLRLLYEVMSDIEGVFAETRNLYALSDFAEHMENAFSHFSSQQENDPADDTTEGVRVLTIHQAKGMEFSFVYLVDATDEFFPRLGRSMTLLDGRSLGQMNKAFCAFADAGSTESFAPELSLSVDEQLREERHLTYVALTRVKERLVICHPQQSNLSEPVQPSPFIHEFLGRDESPDLQQSTDPDKGAAASLSRIDAALNAQEIETALRGCLAEVMPNAEKTREISAEFESLELDAHFICDDSPFEAEPDRTIDLSDHVYSASRLSTYLTCPRMFYYDHLLRVAPERPEDFGLGQLIHKTLELFHDDTRDFKSEPGVLHKAMEKSFQLIWHGGSRDGTREAFRKQYPAMLQQAAVEQKAREILRRYVETETQEAQDREIVACEERVTFQLGDHDFVARIDRIDRINRGHLVIDYKTSSSSLMQAKTIKKKFINVEGLPDYKPKDLQLPLYLMAARAAGYDPIELIYYWLSQEDSGGMFKRSSLRIGQDNPDSLSAEEMAEAEGNIIAVVQRIAAGNFEPLPITAYECTRCAFGGVCARAEEDPVDA
jgi:ATP-dependent exoDNAse (exonuclease V) beta subunit